MTFNSPPKVNVSPSAEVFTNHQVSENHLFLLCRKSSSLEAGTYSRRASLFGGGNRLK